MKILVSGSHGLVGSQLVPFLISQGHQVVRLSRSKSSQEDIFWDPENGQIDADQLEGFDAVVHLAGDNIASGRWTAKKKESIRESRVKGTRLLCETLAKLSEPPKIIVSASAIGYYGDRGHELLIEESGTGPGFLASVCKEWEKACEPAIKRDIRVVQLRIGVVLSLKGGALTKLLPPFQMGIGGCLGSGKQYMSWISLEDLVGIIYFALINENLVGPVNAVTPNSVTNNEFTKALGAALRRPTLFPLPGFAAHLLLGEMADELLLASTRVQPKKLKDNGYIFQYPEIGSFLKQHLRSS